MGNLADAIREKKGTADLITPSNFVNEISGIKTESPYGDDVVFRGSDGTIVYSYTTDGFLELNEMPEQPDAVGVEARKAGWNWELEEAKEYVREYGKLDIGGTYGSTSEWTELHIKIDNEYRMSIQLNFSFDGIDVDIDWGEDNGMGPTNCLSGTTSANHVYNAIGEYVIKIKCNGGTLSLGSDLTETNLFGDKNTPSSTINTRGISSYLRKVIINDTTTFKSYCFQNCVSLDTVLVPNTNNAFLNSIYNYYCFYNCYKLKHVTVKRLLDPIIPPRYRCICDSAFYNCYSLASVSLPSSVTSISNNAFYSCYSLTSVSLPSSVISIGTSAFSYCYSLTSVSLPSSVTSIGNNAFYGCYSLTSVSIPSSVTSIGNKAFYGCYSLTSVSIPSSVTNIGSSAFSYCRSLTSIEIPSSVTNIGSSAFSYCYSLAHIDFSNHTSVPTLGGALFAYIAGDCKIKVPSTLYSMWIGATNWSDISNMIYSLDVYLANQWRLSEDYMNPSPARYYGIYESFSNHKDDSGKATSSIMSINFAGLSLKLLYGSSSESSWDYLMVGTTNSLINNDTVSTDSTVAAHTKYSYNNITPDDILSYGTITLDPIFSGETNSIMISYKKDTSANSRNDRGYIMIPKIQWLQNTDFNTIDGDALEATVVTEEE